MRRLGWGKSTFITVTAAAALATACGGVGPTDLQGTWDATSFRFTNLADASQSVEIVSQGGSFSIVLNANNTFQSTMHVPDMSLETTTGTWAYTDLDGLTLSDTDGTTSIDFDVSMSGSTMTLSSVDGITFDFGDGNVAVQVDAMLTRR